MQRYLSFENTLKKYAFLEYSNRIHLHLHYMKISYGGGKHL